MGVAHIYPGYGLSQERLWLMSAKEIFTISLGSSIIENEPYIQGLLELLKRTSGKDMPLAITEYNGGFVQDKPVPYRHCLGTALLNAEMLRILMKPENKILMANYWQFCNSYWGMIESKGDYMQHDYREPIKYIKRPNYYIFELYNRHFGSELLATDVDSGTYKVQNFSIPYLSVNASINSDKSKVYLMVINKNLDKGISATVDLRGFDPTEKGEAWILNGQNIDSINKDDANNVEIRQVDFVIKDNSFKYTFEPHSLTAVEIKSRSR
jgi:alpha-L-arabinofuranosidase